MNLLLPLLLTATEPSTLTGSIQVGRGLREPWVWLIAHGSGASVRLAGEALVELRNLQSAKVELAGAQDGERFVVQHYRLLSLAGGLRPAAVGTLFQSGADLVLDTGGGTPIPLSASPKLRSVLVFQTGAKIWIMGEKLLSGEIKVSRYGVLREPDPVQAAPHGPKDTGAGRTSAPPPAPSSP